jgi:acyl-CoA synthetase (AMP-forming)/AMP-acid ligase II
VNTLPALLAHHAQTIPDQLFTRILKSGNEIASLTFAQAWELANQWAALFIENGLQPGDAIVLALPNTHEFIGAYYGSLIAGCAPAPVAPPRKLDESDPYLQSIAARARFINAKALILSQDQSLVSNLQSQLFSNSLILSSANLDPSVLPPSPHSPASLGLIQFTSGTSGDQKPVALSQAALIYQAKAIQDSLKLYDRFTDRGISWLPLFHDMGLIGFLLTSGVAGGELTLMQPEDFVLRPTQWLKAITQYKSTITGAPPSAYALCAKRVKDSDVAQYDLSSIRVAMVGAEQVTRDSLTAFAEKFAPAGFAYRAFLPTYGLAENSLAVTMPSPDSEPTFDSIDAASLADGKAVPAVQSSLPETVRQFAGVGSPLPQTQIQVVNDEGIPLPERHIGEITLQSPSVMNGYLNSTNNPIRDGWLFTGDLGYMADGNLYITGRKKEVIIVGGRNYYSDDVEQVVSTVPGVRMDRAVAVGVNEAERATEKLVVLAETDRTDPAERDDLRLAIRATLTQAGYPISEVILLKPKSIQSTLTGKLKRLDCRERYLAGEFNNTP